VGRAAACAGVAAAVCGAGRGSAALGRQRERDLFKKQCSISFMN
jgi:hypothetical protein